MPRFVILEHTDAPDDPTGRHYDLLIEDGPACRTWRLAELPQPGGPAVAAAELVPHRLAWLDHVAGDVSAGRGFARRIDAGSCEPVARAGALELTLHGTHTTSRLLLAAHAEGWLARLIPASTEARQSADGRRRQNGLG